MTVRKTAGPQFLPKGDGLLARPVVSVPTPQARIICLQACRAQSPLTPPSVPAGACGSGSSSSSSAPAGALCLLPILPPSSSTYRHMSDPHTEADPTAAKLTTACFRAPLRTCLGFSSIGHSEGEVDQGFAWERSELRSEGRPKFRAEMGVAGSDVDGSWHCNCTSLVVHWSHLGSAWGRDSNCTGSPLAPTCTSGTSTGTPLRAHAAWYCTDVALVMCLSCAGIVLPWYVLHWFSSGAPLDWRCTGTAMVLDWYSRITALPLHSYSMCSTGTRLAVQRDSTKCEGTELQLCCIGIGIALVLRWCCASAALALNWYCTGTPLAARWYCIDTAVVLHCVHTRTVLGLYWHRHCNVIAPALHWHCTHT